VRPVLQVAGEEHAKLARRQIRTVAPNEGDDSVTQDADQLVG
jgi:hypothetical protein